MAERGLLVCLLSLGVVTCRDASPTGAVIPVATTIEIAPASVSFSSVGETTQLAVTVRDQDGSVMSRAVVTLVSSAETVATVSPTGEITAVGNGDATITATSGAASQTVVVTVEQVATEITLSPGSLVLDGLGATGTVLASVTDANGSTITSPTLTWSTNDAGVATVDGAGAVTAEGEGSTTLTVQGTAGGGLVTETLSITVNGTLAVSTATLPDGVVNVDYGTATLAATGGNGSDTWSLAAGSGPLPAGLALAANGEITGTPTAAGTAAITVEVTDGAQTATQALSITIDGTLAVATATLPDGVSNADYGTVPLAATGGNGSNTWSLAAGSGPLPVGLTLDANGDITGTPTAAGTSIFAVEVTDGVQTATQTLSVTINAALDITTTTLPGGVSNADYGTVPLAATGGNGSNTWSLAAGSGPLPVGLTLATNGSITGTPTTAGTSSFMVEVTDGVQTATRTLSITVDAPLTVATVTLPDGAVNVGYGTVPLTATGGAGGNTWSLAAGSDPLPVGLTLDANGGITGTPTAVGTSTFTVEVTDGVQTATQALSIAVDETLTVAAATLPDGVVNVDYGTVPLAATGGNGSNTWSLAAGSDPLPVGLTLDANGDITGTPTAVGTSNFTAEVTDGLQTATRALSITVNGTLAVTTGTLADGVVNTDYGTVPLAATGGSGSNTWSLAAGSDPLPVGLALDANGDITGTPTAVGTSTFTVEVTDGVQTATQVLSITVNGTLNITTATLPRGVVNVDYGTETLAATGGNGTNTWSLAAGSGPLPAGLALAANGDITGTPTAVGTANATAEVTDGVQTATRTLSITIDATLAVSTATLPDGVVNVDYGTATLAATGGNGTTSWSLAAGSDALPGGLTLAANGEITGTPTAAGTSNVMVEVTDGVQSATRALSITVLATMTVTTSALSDGVVNVDYGMETLTAAGGTGTYAWMLATGSDPLPAGLALAASGDITGTPTAVGTSTFTVEVTSGAQRATQVLSITVNGTLDITTATLPDGVEDVDYGTATLTATGGNGTNTWSLAAGSGPLPVGLTLNANGDITGTPTAAGVSTVTLEVTDDVQTATTALSITVNAVLDITTTTLPNGAPTVAYSQTLAVAGGAGGYVWSLAAGSDPLPVGLTLTANGDITGTPTTPGTSTFAVEATDGVQTAAEALSITVNAALAITTTTLPNGAPTVAYSQTLAATGGAGGYVWSLAAGSDPLPAGVALAANGDITGTPTMPGTSTFTARVVSGDGQSDIQVLSVTVDPTLDVTTTALPNGAPTVAYSQTLAATGGVGGYVWSLATGSGPLPAGLTLGPDGSITGTPTMSGTSNFTVAVTDGVQMAAEALSITVNATLDITTTMLPNGAPTVAYNQTLAATGGAGGYVWSLATGSDPVPAGLTLAADGGLTGTPTTPGTSTFTAQVVSGDGQSDIQVLSIAVNATLDITTTTLPNGAPAVSYNQTLAVTGGAGGYVWSLAAGSGPVPLGLTFAADGSVTGTPTTPGTSTFTAQVVSGDGQSDAQILSITVNSTLDVTTTALPNGAPAVAYSQTLAATGGAGGYVWSLATGSDPLPAGLVLGAGGDITGTPTTPGTSTFTAQVTDGVQTAAEALSITVNATLDVTTTALPNGAPAVAYSQTLAATGGAGGYVWSLATGSDPVPAGLTLAADGRITGTPAAPGTSTFTVQVVSGDGQSDAQILSITVNGTLDITTMALPDGVEAYAYATQTLAATGGAGGYVWSLATGSDPLPAGLVLGANGDITGATPTPGTSVFTVRVASGDGQIDTQVLSIRVNATLTITTATLPNGLEGVPYPVQALAASGGTGSYTWALAVGSGPLPAGLTLATNGSITGMPSADGNSSFTVQVASGTQVVTRTLSIIVDQLVLLPTEFCSANPGSAIATFADASLEGVVRDSIGIGPVDDLTCEMLGTVTAIVAQSLSIANIAGVQNLTNLTVLDLRLNFLIADLTPLMTLTSLTDLLIGDNDISNLGPLQALTNLSYIGLARNPLGSLQPLIDNVGMGVGDVVFIEGTGVNCAEVTSLAGLGVAVFSDCS